MSLCDELHDGANRPASANSRHGLFSGPHIYLNDSYVGSDERRSIKPFKNATYDASEPSEYLWASFVFVGIALADGVSSRSDDKKDHFEFLTKPSHGIPELSSYQIPPKKSDNGSLDGTCEGTSSV
ncbi:hypothetical protein CGMCC3_g12975 [Colletotrichum fructicola]|nr:uncharacterized protein CGMCC3_g12975 [Colletotrichum fructicola]KAE9571025.1 hypothetical protein CGMCC3_g12975 [Colletotrichum fructicola]